MRPLVGLLFLMVVILSSCSRPMVKEQGQSDGDVPLVSEARVTPVEEAEILIMRGVKAYEEGKLDSSIGIWRKALEILPEDEELLNWMGIAYHKRGNLDSARIYFEKCLAVNANNYQAYNNLGYVYFTTGDYLKARELFEKSLAINPFYEQAQLNYDAVRKLLEGKRSLEAFELFEKAAGEDSLVQKINLYRNAIAIDKNYVEAYNNLGVAFYFMGEIDSALIYLKKALDINPEYPEANNNMGFILSQLGFNQRAIPFFMKAISIRPNYTIAIMNLADSYYFLKNYRDARRLLLEAEKLEPDNAEIKRRLKKIEYMIQESQ